MINQNKLKIDSMTYQFKEKYDSLSENHKKELLLLNQQQNYYRETIDILKTAPPPNKNIIIPRLEITKISPSFK